MQLMRGRSRYAETMKWYRLGVIYKNGYGVPCRIASPHTTGFEPLAA